MKTRHAVSLILIVSIALILVLVPTGRRDFDRTGDVYPWAAEVTPAGETHVLGITLGRTTLAQAEQRFRSSAELALFAEGANDLSLEAFFNEVTLGGLSSRVVLSLSVDPGVLAQMRERGGSGERTESGAIRHRLHTDDLALARAAPIWALTYVPYVQLEAALIEQRFGRPDEIVRTSATTAHYLYPTKGLDIMLNDNEREVLQFVRPADFERLREKLVEQ
jgi:hypothetical protein